MKRVKKQCLGSYPRHFTMRFRFKAVADRRQWSSAASIPRLNRRLKLCIHFWAAKLPSHQICRRFRIRSWAGVPSVSRCRFTASSKMFLRILRLRWLSLTHLPSIGQLRQSFLSARYILTFCGSWKMPWISALSTTRYGTCTARTTADRALRHQILKGDTVHFYLYSCPFCQHLKHFLPLLSSPYYTIFSLPFGHFVNTSNLSRSYFYSKGGASHGDNLLQDPSYQQGRNDSAEHERPF